MGISHNTQANEDSEYLKAVKKICEIINEKNFSFIIAFDRRLYPLTLGFYKERALLKILHSHTETVIDNKIKKIEVVEKDDTNDMGIKKRVAFLDLLLKSTIDGKYLSRDDIKEEVDTFMFEGHDTTSSAISFALYALSNHPEIQQKVLEEQHAIFGDIKTAKPNFTQLNEMKYLELVIKETLRLYPSVPFYTRKIPEDFKWENITFPKGQQVFLFAYGVHRNPNYYPEPHKFIPERFEKIDGTRPYIYIPFSAGPRNCIGQKFAMLELKSTISKVIRNYELFPDKNYELKLAPELILVSKTGVRLSLRKRY